MKPAAAELDQTITLEATVTHKKNPAQVRRAAMAALHDLASEPEA